MDAKDAETLQDGRRAAAVRRQAAALRDADGHVLQHAHGDVPTDLDSPRGSAWVSPPISPGTYLVRTMKPVDPI